MNSRKTSTKEETKEKKSRDERAKKKPTRGVKQEVQSRAIRFEPVRRVATVPVRPIPFASLSSAPWRRERDGRRGAVSVRRTIRARLAMGRKELGAEDNPHRNKTHRQDNVLRVSLQAVAATVVGTQPCFFSLFFFPSPSAQRRQQRTSIHARPSYHTTRCCEKEEKGKKKKTTRGFFVCVLAGTGRLLFGLQEAALLGLTVLSERE